MPAHSFLHLVWLCIPNIQNYNSEENSLVFFRAAPTFNTECPPPPGFAGPRLVTLGRRNPPPVSRDC